MRRVLVTAVALLLAPAVLFAQTPAAPAAAPKPAAPAPTTPAPAAPAPAAAKPATTPAAPAAAPTTPAQPAPAPAAAPAQGQAAAQPPAPPQPENFTYNPEGRRDPFTNLLGSGGGDRNVAISRRADGAAGLTVAEISIRGILQSRSGLIAMVQGPDNKTYIVHQGDRLLDGAIKSINPQGLVLIQEVNDPLSLVKQREVSKLLRSLEGVK